MKSSPNDNKQKWCHESFNPSIINNECSCIPSLQTTRLARVWVSSLDVLAALSFKVFKASQLYSHISFTLLNRKMKQVFHFTLDVWRAISLTLLAI
jgi:hypothetical protein